MTVENERQTGAMHNTGIPNFTSAPDIVRYATSNGHSAGIENAEDTYYGIPLLKKPKWGWEIALYFFFEGISAGAFLLAALNELTNKDRDDNLSRVGFYVSFLALLPCPPLLVADLGRPDRFHHMLRVFKPSSPMNLGAWALSAFSLHPALISFKQLTGDVTGPKSLPSKIGAMVPSRVLHASGIPFALTMISYPGVLLSTTSTPVWSRSRFLGPLIAASSISTAASTLSLVMAAFGNNADRALSRLAKVETAAKICESACLVSYLVTSEDAAKPLTGGKYSKHLWLGAVAGGLVAPTLLSLAKPRKKSTRKAKTILSSLLSIAGGLALKWAITHAGKESAMDIQATHKGTKPNTSATGWPQP